jgi:zinc transport system ATP-binding protein
MSLISCKNASFAYEGNVVIPTLNIEVASGDYICVTGPNGAGKSTLIKGLLKLLTPKSGSVEYGDGLTLYEVGYLPQQMEPKKDFPASVFEVALSGRLGLSGALPFYTKTDKLAAHDNLKRLGVCELSGKCYRELSGGQQRRVLLARALCAAVRLIILDEPTAGLDAAAAADFYDLIERLNRDGLAIILVSHDINRKVGREFIFGNGEPHFADAD